MKDYNQIFANAKVKPRGLIHVTGPSGVGKSLFAIGLVQIGLDPKRVAVFDFEQSLKQHHDSLGFGKYYDMTQERLTKFGLFGVPRKLFQHTLELVQQLPGNTFDLIVVDNVVPLEDGIEDLVENEPGKFGLTQNQVDRGMGLKWRPIKSLYSTFIQSLAEKAPLFIFTSQLAQTFANAQAVPGLFHAQGKKDVLSQQSTLRLWLRFNTISEIPDALVLKSRLVYPQTLGETLIWSPMLPYKISPASWTHILSYLEKPPDIDHLEVSERPSNSDWAILRDSLTPDQLEIFKLLATGATRDTTGGSGSSDQPEQVRPTQSKIPSTIADFIVKLSDIGLTVEGAMIRLGIETVQQIKPSEDWIKLTISQGETASVA
jgi:hypothetical protein